MFWKNWDRTDYKTAREKQGAMLHRFLKTQVLPFSPYYRELFRKEGLTANDIHSVDDLRKIPFTRKADIVPSKDDPAKPRKFILQPDPKTYSSKISLGKKLSLVKDRLITGRDMKDLVMDEYLPIQFIATTGRSAKPTPFVYTEHDRKLFNEAARRLLTLAGAVRGVDTIANIFPYAPHLAFWIVFQAGIATGSPMFHSGGGKVLGTDKIINTITGMKSTFVVGIPGYMYHVLRIAQERGADMSAVHTIILGAERVTDGLKKRLAELLVSMGSKNPKILSTYGFTEARTAWIDCPTEKTLTESTGYHLFPDMEIFEIIDPVSGEPVGEGEPGEVAYTSLDWRGTVVLRYLNGDFAKEGIVTKPCPACGRMVPRMTTNLSRITDRGEVKVASDIQKVKGTLVDYNDFYPLFSDISEIVEWQVEFTKRNLDPHDLDEIHIHLAVTSKCDEGELVQFLKKKMIEVMEVAPSEIFFRSAADMSERLGMETSPKEIRILDRRPELLAKEEDG